MKKGLTIFLFFSFFIPVLQATLFSDVPKDYLYYEAIKQLSKAEIISGYEDRTFKPGKVINRAEFLKIAIGAKLDTESLSELQEDETSEDCFMDVEAEWFAPYVCYAKANGWVKGYADGTFHPASYITFAEAFTILGRIFDLNIERLDDFDWYYPYQRYFNLFDLVGNIEQSMSFQLNRGEMASFVYAIQKHLEETDAEEIEEKISEQKESEEFKLQVFHLVNAERMEAGVGPLIYNLQLEKTAQIHAEDMVERDFFAHVNPDGVDVLTRVKTYHYDQRDVGENIAKGQMSPEAVMEGWMNSEPHRENLLKANFTEMGVGLTLINPDDESAGYAWTQVFGKPCEERDNMIGCTTRSDYQERNADAENEADKWESPYTWY